MGTGFWIIQAMLLIGAVATAVSVEREHRRDERDPDSAPRVKIPIRPPRHVGATTPDLSPHAAAQFTLLERSRLLVLRGWVQEARAHQGRWYDDLVPDDSHPPNSTPPAVVPPNADRAPMSRRLSGRTLVLIAGVLSLAFGCLGIWRTNGQMDGVERAEQAIVATPKTSLASRLVPGVIASPAKYLGAVNSSGGSSGPGDPLAAMAMLELKQAMDRYQAVLLLGLAFLAGSLAGWPPNRSQAASADGEQQSSIPSDIVPFIAVAALLFAALSFFELP